MSDYPHRVQVESIRWLDAFPGLHLFGSLRQSLAPARMFLALLLVIFLFLGGKALDFVWGDRVHANELARYQQLNRDNFRDFLTEQHGYQARLAADTGVDTMDPIFQTLVDAQLKHFNGMVNSALALNFGLTDMLSGETGGVIGHLRAMVLTIPGWMIVAHPGYSAVFLLYAFVLTMVLGGAITRLAALNACRGIYASPFDALRFAADKAVWLIAAPLLPLVLVAVIAVILALGGLVFFNLPVLDVLGGLLFFLMLALGAVAAVLLLGLAFSGNLLTPAIAVEDADAFDAVSRSFSYVLAHPWRYLFYLAVALVYGAVGYLLVGLVLFLTLWATKTFVALLAFTEVSDGLTRLDAILPDPRLGDLNYAPRMDQLDGSGKVAGTFVSVWIKLLLAVLPAYCVSYYFTAATWIYLLLRRSADGASFDEIALRDAPPPAVPDKVEPAAASVPPSSESDAD